MSPEAGSGFFAGNTAGTGSAFTTYFCGVLAVIGTCLLFGSAKPVTFGSILMAIAVSGAAAGWVDTQGIVTLISVATLETSLETIGGSAMRLVRSMMGGWQAA